MSTAESLTSPSAYLSSRIVSNLAEPRTPCVCRAAYLDESDAQGTSNALDASRKLSVLSCRECAARHVRIPRAQGECQWNRLQLAPAGKARDLVSTPAHLVVLLRIRPPKIPRRLLPLRGQQIVHLSVVQESCQAGWEALKLQLAWRAALWNLRLIPRLGAPPGGLQPRLMAEVSSDCTHKASMVSSLLYSSAARGDGAFEAFW